MKTLKKTLAGLLYTGATLPFVLLAVGMLGGCQLEPKIEFLQFPPPTIAFPPDTAGEQQPKLADIATRKFSIAKGSSIVGSLAVISTQDGDTLSDIARHFGLGYNDIIRANPHIRPWTPGAGERILLPLQFILPDAPRNGIVLNLANMRMFYYPAKQPGAMLTYPVGVGRDDWNTPLGQTTIVAKTIKPTWTVPESIRREHAKKGAAVDWEKVERILQRADGIPAPILAASPDLPELVAKAPEVQHPGHFYGQSVAAELTDSGWAILVADFDNQQTAQALAAMLNHQGPPIPARKVEKDGSYQVIAGPFKNQKEAKTAAQRIKMDFDADAKLLPPAMVNAP